MHERAILRCMIDAKAVILQDGRDGVTSYAAYPRGDRRKRPSCFVPATMLKHFIADGVCIPTPRGFEIVQSAQQRHQGGHSAQHRDIISETVTDEHGRFRTAQINRHTRSPLHRLARRKRRSGERMFCDAEIEAGHRLARDYERSSLCVSVTQKYDNVGGGVGSGRGPEDVSAAALDAKRRYMDALDMLGPGLDRIVSAICCHNKDLSQIERDEGYSRNSGLAVLKLGLQRLSQFYGTQAGFGSRAG